MKFGNVLSALAKCVPSTKSDPNSINPHILAVWVLDVTFAEDASRKTIGYFTENFNIIFKSVITILNKRELFEKSIPQKNLKY